MKLGGLDISTVKLGASQVQAIYQGENLVWQNAPVATAATGVGQTSFTANWNAYTGAVVYLLDVSTSATFDTFIYENQQVNAPTTSYVVIGLNPNTTYYYRVRASTEALTDPDAQAFFDRVTNAEGTLSTTEQDAVNTLVIQMKADGIWTKMKAIYPMVGASAAACAQNLKSSSFTGTFTATGWTFASTGVTPNGTSAYMDSGLNVSTELSANDSHISVYSRTLNLSNSSTSIGAFVSQSQEFTLWANHNTLGKLMIHYKYPTGANIVSSTDSRGFFIGSRTSNSSGKLYHDGSLISTNTNTDVGSLPSANVWIGGSQNNTRDVKESAFASIGDGLTDTEASDFYTAVQAFQTTLSRQV